MRREVKIPEELAEYIKLKQLYKQYLRDVKQANHDFFLNVQNALYAVEKAEGSPTKYRLRVSHCDNGVKLTSRLYPEYHVLTCISAIAYITIIKPEDSWEVATEKLQAHIRYTLMAEKAINNELGL